MRCPNPPDAIALSGSRLCRIGRFDRGLSKAMGRVHSFMTNKGVARMTTILGSGDTVYGRPDMTPWIEGVAPTLKTGDVVIGHIETPYTLNPSRTGVNMARGTDPEQLRFFAAAGFNMATLA